MVMDVAAFTIQNAFEANYPVVPEEAVAVINVGATLSNINIIAGGTSAFTRDVTVGGNAFTEEIQKRLNVSQEEAEAWKIGSAGEGVSEVVPAGSRGRHRLGRRRRGGQVPALARFLPGVVAATRPSRRSTCAAARPRCRRCKRRWRPRRALPVEVMDPFRKVAVDEHRFDMAFVQQHSAEAAVAVGLSLRRPGDKQ